MDHRSGLIMGAMLAQVTTKQEIIDKLKEKIVQFESNPTDDSLFEGVAHSCALVLLKQQIINDGTLAKTVEGLTEVANAHDEYINKKH